MLTAAGEWPAYWLETNLVCLGQTVGSSLGDQHASRIGFSVATTMSNKVVAFTSFSGVCPDCCVVSVLPPIEPCPKAKECGCSLAEIAGVLCCQVGVSVTGRSFV